jgi:hypothetical protein
MSIFTTLPTRELVIHISDLRKQYNEMTSRFQRHGWPGGFTAYDSERKELFCEIIAADAELHRRYRQEKAIEQAHTDREETMRLDRQHSVVAA